GAGERPEDTMTALCQSLWECLGAARQQPAGRSIEWASGFALVEPSSNIGEARYKEDAVFRAVAQAMSRLMRSARAAGSGHVISDKYRDDDSNESIGSIAEPIPVFKPSDPVANVARLFEVDPNVHAVVIADGKRPVGLLMKEKLYQLLAGQFGLSLYWNRPVARTMDVDPLIVEAAAPLEEVSQLAMSRTFDQLYDVIVITRSGELIGAATIRA